ncbi:hypothetical protein HK096_007754, partial [Nowakowskiella sp. JEL0078]
IMNENEKCRIWVRDYIFKKKFSGSQKQNYGDSTLASLIIQLIGGSVATFARGAPIGIGIVTSILFVFIPKGEWKFNYHLLILFHFSLFLASQIVIFGVFHDTSSVHRIMPKDRLLLPISPTYTKFVEIIDSHDSIVDVYYAGNIANISTTVVPILETTLSVDFSDASPSIITSSSIFVDSKHPAPTVAVLQGDRDPNCLINNRCSALFTTDSFSGSHDFLVQGSHLVASSQFRVVVFHKKLKTTQSYEITGTVALFAQTPTFKLSNLLKCQNGLPSDNFPEPPSEEEFVINVAATSFLCKIDIAREIYRKSEPGVILVAPLASAERSHGIFVRLVRIKPWEPIQDLFLGVILSIFFFVISIVLAPFIWSFVNYFISGGEGFMESVTSTLKASFEWAREKLGKKYDLISSEEPSSTA